MREEITYMERNGYLYPDLALPEQEEVVIGRFGQRHKRYLKECRKWFYFKLLTSGKLTSYLAEMGRHAREMFETIVNQTKEARGITEELKAQDPMAWVREMNSIVNMAEEFVNREVVFA